MAKSTSGIVQSMKAVEAQQVSANMETIGENVAFRIEGKKLFIEVDLMNEVGPSASGKTTIVAKSGGVDSKFKFGTKEYTINCNVYKK